MAEPTPNRVEDQPGTKQATGRVGVVSPSGETLTVPVGQLEAARAQGYSEATPDDILAAKRASKFGGLGHQVLAGAASFAREGTLGASDVVIPRLAGAMSELAGGRSAEDVAAYSREALGAYKTEHAGITMGAGLAGMLKGAVPGVGGAAESALGRAGVGAAGKFIGRGAAEGFASEAGRAISEAAIENKPLTSELVLAGLRQGAIGGAIGGAGTGLLLGGGKLARAALAPTARGIKAVAGRAFGAAAEGVSGRIAKLLRGPAGLTMGAEGRAGMDLLSTEAGRRAAFAAEDLADIATRSAEPRLSRILEHAEGITQLQQSQKAGVFSHLVEGDAVAQIRHADDTLALARETLGKLEGAAGEMAISQKALSVAKARFDALESRLARAAAEGNGKAAFTVADEVKRQMGRTWKGATRAARSDSFEAPLYAASARELGSAYETMRTGLERQDIWGKAGLVQQLINKPTTEMLGVNQTFRQRFTTEFGRAADGISPRDVADPGKLKSFFSSITDAKGDLNKRAIHEWLAGQEGRARAFLDHAGRALPASQKAAAKSLLSESKALREILEQGGTDIAAQNQMKALLAQEGGGGLSSGILGGAIATGTPLGLLAYPVMRPFSAMRQIVALEGLAGRAADRIRGAITGAARKGAPGGASYMIPRMAGPLVNRYLSHDDRAGAARTDAARLRSKSSADLAAQLRSEMVEQAPNAKGMADATAAAAANRHEYLQKAAPPTLRTHLLGPLPSANPMQVEQWERTKKAALDPPSVIEAMRDGTLSPSAVDTLKQASPALYQDVARQMMDTVADLQTKGKVLPYEQRLSMAYLLPDARVEPTLDPDFMRAAQSAMLSVEQSAQNVPRRGSAPRVGRRMDPDYEDTET